MLNYFNSLRKSRHENLNLFMWVKFYDRQLDPVLTLYFVYVYPAGIEIV